MELILTMLFACGLYAITIWFAIAIGFTIGIVLDFRLKAQMYIETSNFARQFPQYYTSCETVIIAGYISHVKYRSLTYYVKSVLYALRWAFMISSYDILDIIYNNNSNNKKLKQLASKLHG